MLAVMFALGVVFLVGGAELLVRGASRLAVAFGMSPLVIGLTIVAFGTSAPELAVSVQGAVSGSAGVALGNVVGSNIANILLILGLAALIVPLTVDQQLIRWDVPLLIAASAVAFAMGVFDGGLGRVDGSLLFVAGLAYIAFAVRQSRRETKAVAAEYQEALEHTEGLQPGEPAPRPAVNVLFVLAGLGLLVVGARWLVDAAIEVAKWFGLSELVIGLTVVAVGTSLPEIATSITAALRGERDIAVGNAIGSNIMNLVLVLGPTAVLAPAGVPVPASALAFDMPVMIAVAVGALPIFFSGHRIARWEGVLFLAMYAAYLTYVALSAQGSPLAVDFKVAMLWFVLPLVGVTVLVFAWREWQSLRASAPRSDAG
ncbi:MAG: calcium/sodium antiporter [Myxococcota bacterium]